LNKVALFVAVACLAALFGLPLLIGIWLPDVFIPTQHILAEQRLSDGNVFKRIHYWNEWIFTIQMSYTFCRMDRRGELLWMVTIASSGEAFWK
jgi:hypothetical protein